MHIYGSTLSPFVQRVLLAARTKGHELVVKPPPGGSTQSEEFAAISPMGRIPLLEEEDGWRLCESSAILAYLDETLAGPSLLPADPRQRAFARQIVSLGMCEVAAGIRPQMVVRLFHYSDSEELAAAGIAQLEKGLGAIERLVDPAHAWVAGDAIGIADALLVPLFTLMTVIDPVAHTARLIADRPKLAACYDRARQDPIAGRTVTEMTEGFAKMMARMQAPPVAAA